MRRTTALRRSWRRPKHGALSHILLSRQHSLGSVSRCLLLCSLYCLALQATRVHAVAAGGTVSFSAWPGESNGAFRGSSSSDDEGSDVESSSEEEPSVPFVVVPNAEVHVEDLGSSSEDEEWVQNASSTVIQENEQRNDSQDIATGWLEEDDGTAGMTALEKPAAPGPIEHENEADDSEVESDGEEDTVEAGDTPVVSLPAENISDAEEEDESRGEVESDGEEEKVEAGDAPEVSLPPADHVSDSEEEDASDREEEFEATQTSVRVDNAEEGRDESETADKVDGAPEAVLPVQQPLDDTDSDDTIGKETDQVSHQNEAEPRIMSATQALQVSTVTSVEQEVQSEDEASDWVDDERAVTEDEGSDIETADPPAQVAVDADKEAEYIATSGSADKKTLGLVEEDGQRHEEVPHAPRVSTVSSRNQSWSAKPRRRYKTPSEMGSSSQPLKTLKKLQQMLDETDYMTAAPGLRGDEMKKDIPAVLSDEEGVWFDQEALVSEYEQSGPIASSPDTGVGMENVSEGEKLWTSKDRMKYKKQQQRIRRAKQEQRRLEQQLRSPPLHPNSSDDDASDGDTDDGLGYTLPNLPVYFSDAEGTTDLTDTGMEQSSSQQLVQQQPFFQPPPPPFEQRGPYQYPPPGYNPYGGPPPSDPNMGQPISPYMGYSPNPYLPYPPYGPYGPQQQQLYASQYAAAWAAAAAASSGTSYGGRPPYSRPYPPQTGATTGMHRRLDGNQNTVSLQATKSITSKAGNEPASQRGTTSNSLPLEKPPPIATAFPVDQANSVVYMASQVPVRR